MTRPICHTITPGYPCYPCMGITPSAGETATVTRSSCSTSNPIMTTITAQTCHACEALTYTTTSLPGYTPGDECKDCQPYLSGDLTLPPTTATVDAISATTARISKPGCHNCPDEAPTRYPGASEPVDGPYSRPPIGGGDRPTTKLMTVVPGTPSLPTLSLSATSGGGYGGPPMSSTTSATMSKPSTVPSYITAAGGPRGLIWELSTVVAAAVLWALLMV
ncbi:hypothetical protein BR93DRAFT_901596 [Coniochaeta sp. PMI_546]|nr:hypothetical protein BR93DRAFT_901596 [Coniochaeta sp. PMI_546]